MVVKLWVRGFEIHERKRADSAGEREELTLRS